MVIPDPQPKIAVARRAQPLLIDTVTDTVTDTVRKG